MCGCCYTQARNVSNRDAGVVLEAYKAISLGTAPAEYGPDVNFIASKLVGRSALIGDAFDIQAQYT